MDDQPPHIAELLNIDLWQRAEPSARNVGATAFALVDAVIAAKLAPYAVDNETAQQMQGASVRALAQQIMKIVPEKLVIPKLRHLSNALDRIIECDEGDDDFRRRYASMIASAMNQDTFEKFHPAFPSVLSQLSNDDLKVISGYSISSAPSRHTFFCKVHLSDGAFAEKLAHRTFVSQGTSWREVGMLNSADYVSNLTRLCIVNSIRSEKDWSLAEFALFLKKHEIETDLISDGNRKYLVDRGIDIVSVHEEVDLFPLSKFGYEFVRACGIV